MIAISLGKNEVQWDGQCIIVWASNEHGRLKCEISRDTIYSLPRFADAISREIDRDVMKLWIDCARS